MLHVITRLFHQETEEEEDQESPRRRRSIQESLSLPVPTCYPGNGQRDDLPETSDRSRSKAELSSSPSLPASQRDSIESGGSPSLSPPKDTSSPHSPSGFPRNVKKRESKGKGKELKGTADPYIMARVAWISFYITCEFLNWWVGTKK